MYLLFCLQTWTSLSILLVGLTELDDAHYDETLKMHSQSQLESRCIFCWFSSNIGWGKSIFHLESFTWPLRLNTYHPKLWNPSGGVIARLFTAWVIFKRLTLFAAFLFTPSLSFRAERSAWAQLVIHMYLCYRIFGVYGEGQIHYMHFQGLLIHAHELKKMYLSVKGIPLGLLQTKGRAKRSRTEGERKIMRVLCKLLTAGAECGSTSWREAALPGWLLFTAMAHRRHPKCVM